MAACSVKLSRLGIIAGGVGRLGAWATSVGVQGRRGILKKKQTAELGEILSIYERGGRQAAMLKCYLAAAAPPGLHL
jgi:hypothetical protein